MSKGYFLEFSTMEGTGLLDFRLTSRLTGEVGHFICEDKEATITRKVNQFMDEHYEKLKNDYLKQKGV